MVVGAVPNHIAMGVAIGVQILARTGEQIQGRYRTNTYLQRINETLFMPHGLYCLIMMSKPDQPGQQFVEVDMNAAAATSVAKALHAPETTVRKGLKNMRLKDGQTVGEFALPDSAPLIYPAIDRAAMGDSPLPEQKQSKLKSSQKFLADYMDRRAQSSYAALNPGSKLATAPQKEYSSRFADPNHPMHHGGPITFLSGGTIDIGGHKRKRRAERAQRRAAKQGRVLSEEELHRVAWRLDKKNQRKGLKRVMQQDVFYMMICNLPSEEEMEMARGQMKAWWLKNPHAGDTMGVEAAGGPSGSGKGPMAFENALPREKFDGRLKN